jgi:hypothetical protein
MCSWMEMRVLYGIFRVGKERYVNDARLRCVPPMIMEDVQKQKREPYTLDRVSLCVYVHGALCTLIMS